MAYKDASQPVEARVADLLGRMTLDEKLAQMTVLRPSGEPLSLADQEVDVSYLNMVHGAGGILRVGLSRTSHEAAEAVNTIQRYLVTQTRLKIPAFIVDEALHGLMGKHATSFPQAIALASTWDPALIERVFTATAAEMRARGGTWALTPVLDLARDPRWGRTEETYGEDPYLASQMGSAAVRGLQGTGRVLATAKHFAAHGQPESGTNCGPGNFAEHELRSVFLEPFRAAIQDAGVGSVMASYNEIDGIPAHVNTWLLQKVLRREWGFDGIVTSDGAGILDLVRLHHVAENTADAARQALLAGIDFELDACFSAVKDQVLGGQLAEEHIDRAVAAILRQKFLLGLFEQPYSDPVEAEAVVGCTDHLSLALEAARKSIVLLKNDPLSDGSPLLPLAPDRLRRVAVIGPNAGVILQGGYSAEPSRGVSVLDGIRRFTGKQIEVLYAEGCRITEDGGGWQGWWQHEVRLPDPAEEAQRITEAVEVARQADVAILVLGENESVCREGWGAMHLGDRDSLDLPGQQEALIQAVVQTGTPTVLTLFNGRPLSIVWAEQHVPAILECWYLGQEGGTALAEALFGAINPGGRLPITFPRSVGQIPAYYYHKPSARRGYLFTENSPLFAFGHGLSYTTFEYSALHIEPGVIQIGMDVHITLTVSNTGSRAGDEVVQIYIRDCVSSVTRPVRELKAFRRLTLQPGESREVIFTLEPGAFALLNAEYEWVVEPGEFEIMVGGSLDSRLEARLQILASD
ncbi:MAG: glycoside hydrolase family 3 C-terminal domain-containing protein [Anaerolineae bacterium]|nr:glycoside hydrolase family 3 C-terminal domain-containing protein [Anaerolineae bacterium]